VPLLKSGAAGAWPEWLVQRDKDRESSTCHKASPLSIYLFPSRGSSGYLTRHRFYLMIKEFALARRCRALKGHAPHAGAMPLATHLLPTAPIYGPITDQCLGHADVARPKSTPTC